MSKIDFKRELKYLYRPSAKKFEVVEVPPLQYLAIDGHGTPGVSQAYKDALEALFPVAYKIKFMSKKELDRDYTVMPLEGLWWAEDMDSFTVKRDKSQWDWTMLIMQPAWITVAHFEEAREEVDKQKGPIALSQLRLETLEEGLAVQILHIGSYDDEGPVLEKMHYEFIPANDYVMVGKHHEIYLSDPRRVAPEKLRTILRQPVAPKPLTPTKGHFPIGDE